jgi:NAD(P)-dependent dehydrogenase (short-subunit alcohol dehydrogenase family)
MASSDLRAGALFDLTGKTAIVTGASSGLGVMFANALATNGANVVLAARRTDRLEEVQKALPEGTRSLTVACDITAVDQIEAMCEVTTEEFGGIDVFVANAGVVAEGLPAIEKTPPELFAAGIDANVNGTFNCLTSAGRRMLAAGGGSIIVIASIAGMSGHRGYPAGYGAAKAAQIQLVQQLGSTWADRGVRVNAISPGWFPSEMTDDLIGIPAWQARLTEQTPLGRLGEQEELIGPLLLLASDAGSYMTGVAIPVDGGWTSTSGSSPYSEEVAGILTSIMPDGLGMPVLPGG